MYTQITLPSAIKTIMEEGNTGVYEVENLYPGYGHTLGNSLRRIILSSLPGVAIVQVKIDGVEHEFSTLDGVKEDVITILLNLKKVRFKLLTDESQMVTLNVKGPKKVYAKDFDLPGQVELLTEDEYIAEITSDRELKMELKLEKGLGFLPKEVLQKDKVDIGTIIPDATFSPIRRVNYEVENMRVEDRTDFNRLRIFIETDGTLSPRQALEDSIQIMISQLKSLLGEGDTQMTDSAENTKDNTEVFKIPTEELELSSRIKNALEDAGIRTVGGLVKKSKEELLDLPGLGEKAVDEIKEALQKINLDLS